MPRNARCVLPGLPYHVTQRGTDHQAVFYTHADRNTYLSLVARHQPDAGVRVLAYCLMTNHVHFVVVPKRADSLAVLFRRVHGAYSQWLNTRLSRTGHLWQNRFYSCPMSERHLWIGLHYVEANPVRAHMTIQPAEYRWSSAAVHLQGVADKAGVLDMEFFQRSGGVETWRELHEAQENPWAILSTPSLHLRGASLRRRGVRSPVGTAVRPEMASLELRKGARKSHVGVNCPIGTELSATLARKRASQFRLSLSLRSRANLDLR